MQQSGSPFIEVGKEIQRILIQRYCLLVSLKTMMTSLLNNYRGMLALLAFAFQRSIYKAFYSWGSNFKKQITAFRF